MKAGDFMSKRLLSIIIIIGVIFLLTACGQTATMPPEDSSGISTETPLPELSETATSEPEVLAEPTEPDISEATPPATDNTNTTANNTPAGTSSQKPKDPPPTSTTAKTTSKPTTPPQSNAPPQTTSNPSPPIIDPPIATAADAEAIANKIIEYINQHRIAQGAGAATKLPGLTQVAQYRSRQIVSNFAHDINDINEATRHFKYGNHVVYGELNYYDHQAREAIGRSGGNLPVDGLANLMANGFKNSTGHWRYVGGAAYKYIAVGATFANGEWFICVLMSETNTYG